MDVDAIIGELRKRKLIERGVPQGHHVERHERRTLDQEVEPLSAEPPLDEGRAIEADPGGPASEGLPDDLIWVENPDVDLREAPVDPDVDREVRLTGVDALAWYRSFHWEPVQRWGIYIRDSAVVYLAATVFEQLSLPNLYGRAPNNLDRMRQAFRLLFLHEFFHYATDVAAAGLELADQTTPARRYSPYIREVYLRPRQAGEPLEEALANAFAYDALPGTRFRTALRRFMKAQPSGYSEFMDCRGVGFDRGRRDLATALATASSVHGSGHAPLEILIATDSEDLRFADVPVYLVREMWDPRYVLGFVKSIPLRDQVETERFQRDLRKLPDGVANKYYKKTRRYLDEALRARGLNFEALRGCDTVFSVRVDEGHRITLRPRNGKWELLRIGKHDAVYRNPGGC